MTRVAIAGFGTVGQGVWHILAQERERLVQLPGGAPEAAAVLVRDTAKQRDMHAPRALFTDDPEAFLNTKGIGVLFEATGDTALGYRLMTEAMRRGIHVITASKATVSAHMEELHALAAEQGVHFLYEAAVGGGTPLLKPLKDLPVIGEVTGLRGIVNGSCNYILSSMTTAGADFDEVAAQARRLGYLEASADDDLMGWDTRRKLRILCTLAFRGAVREDGIPCMGIDRIRAQDIAVLSGRGLTVKLLGTAVKRGADVSASVFPQALPGHDMLAGVGGAYNQVEVRGAYFDTVRFFGSGAGRLPTAHAMVNDLADVLLNRQPVQSPLGTESLRATAGAEMGTFYLRGVPETRVTAQEEWGAGVLTQPMPLDDVLSLMAEFPRAAAVRVPSPE